MMEAITGPQQGSAAQAGLAGKPAYPVNLISLRMSHHASASGYDRLTDFLDASVIHTPQTLGMAQRIVGKLCKPIIRRSGLLWYHREALMAELAVARQWLRSRGQVFHFLYGENQFRYAGLLRGLHRNNTLVATYHTPEQRFREVVRNAEFIKSLDAAIVMSTIQKEYLGDYLPAERIHFVPHGIDTEFYAPAPLTAAAIDATFRCIAVGSHLRDHATLAVVARMIADAAPEIRFDVVTRPDLFFHYSGLPNVDLHSGVTDGDLVSMYQRSNLMVLPLKDATANNSILEALACGLPIVSTELAGLRDYVDAKCAVLTAAGDAEHLAQAVMDLRADHDRLQAMGAASRRKAEEFDWKRVAELTVSVYDRARTEKG